MGLHRVLSGVQYATIAVEGGATARAVSSYSFILYGVFADSALRNADLLQGHSAKIFYCRITQPQGFHHRGGISA